MAGKLEGKIALITGGNSGIGFATAKRFVQEGGFVYLTARQRLFQCCALAVIPLGCNSVFSDIIAVFVDVTQFEESAGNSSCLGT